MFCIYKEWKPVKRFVYISLSSLFLLLNLYGCGIDDNTSSQNSSYDYRRFLSDYRCEDADPYYQKLIRNKDYQTAIAYVCKSYRLSSTDKNIYAKPKHTTGYAYTHSITNNITIGIKAFKHASCKEPYDGWLAAIVGHEIIHTTQSRIERYRGAMLDSRLNAQLELSAWGYMWANARRFKLTSKMKIEVDSQIEAYKKESIKSDRTAPAD